MPIPGARYRVQTTAGGKQVRLAFRGQRVVEAKNLKTGATHTPSEFDADHARSDRHMKAVVHHALGLAHHMTRLRRHGRFTKKGQ